MGACGWGRWPPPASLILPEHRKSWEAMRKRWPWMTHLLAADACDHNTLMSKAAVLDIAVDRGLASPCRAREQEVSGEESQTQDFIQRDVMKQPQINVAMKPDCSGVELSMGRVGEPVLCKIDLTAAALEMLIAGLVSCSGQLKAGRVEEPGTGTVKVPPPFINPAWRLGADAAGHAVLSFELLGGCWVSFQLSHPQIANLTQALRHVLEIKGSAISKAH